MGGYVPGMCGRYTRRYTWRQVREFLDLRFPERMELEASYNVAPTQRAPIVRARPEGRELAMAVWGLVPSWAEDAKIGARMVNARAETVASKPAFRGAYKHRRCVVPISGFYEWQAREKGAKRPYYVTRADDQIMCLAGLWERWEKGEEALETYTIVTTDANELLAPIHNRMPVVLEPERVGVWLGERGDEEELASLLRPAPAGVLQAREVSTRVGNVANNDPSLIEAVEDGPGEGMLFGA